MYKRYVRCWCARVALSLSAKRTHTGYSERRPRGAREWFYSQRKFMVVVVVVRRAHSNNNPTRARLKKVVGETGSESGWWWKKVRNRTTPAAAQNDSGYYLFPLQCVSKTPCFTSAPLQQWRSKWDTFAQKGRLSILPIKLKSAHHSICARSRLFARDETPLRRSSDAT